jgi:hypothetical protein
MALNTGKKIVHRSWDVIPIPDLVVSRVNALCRYQPHHMKFTYRHGCLIGDIEIPGLDSGEEEDAHFPGIMRSHEWSWKDQRLAPHKVLRLIIPTSTKTTPLQFRYNLPKKCQHPKRQHRSQNQHIHKAFTDPRGSGSTPIPHTPQV